jgi:hypothetical protein
MFTYRPKYKCVRRNMEWVHPPISWCVKQPYILRKWIFIYHNNQRLNNSLRREPLYYSYGISVACFLFQFLFGPLWIPTDAFHQMTPDKYVWHPNCHHYHFEMFERNCTGTYSTSFTYLLSGTPVTDGTSWWKRFLLGADSKSPQPGFFDVIIQ